MCGIYGFFASRGQVRDPRELLERMAGTLFHRGPDEGGLFHQGAVALGSRRLSIVDLVSGRQPLMSETGEVQLVCNGEIYNAPELRRALEARHTFRTHSDNEVLVHLYEDLGSDFLTPVEGMFALALWDARRSRLLLARDRAGEKPLFHAWHRGVFYFASELSALRHVAGLGADVDAEALHLYLTFGYFPAPWTPYRGIRKMEPGTLATLDAVDSQLRTMAYWNLHSHALAGALRREGSHSKAQAAHLLRQKIDASVRRQLMADVPIGVALSGGLDSGWIATVAARQSPEPLHTFTVSFAEPSYDEGSAAAWLARRIGAVHHVARADGSSLVRALQKLSVHLDEPLGDPAVLPTFLLAEEARRYVKVILGGEGADELFGGYPTYVGHLLAGRYARLPVWFRERLLLPLIEAWPPSERKVSLEFLLKRFVRDAVRPCLERHAAWFGVMRPEEAAAIAGPRLTATGLDAAPVRLLRDLLGVEEEWGRGELEKLLYIDFRTYLGEGLLTKLDRVCMACSLESRSPYLGRDVVEFAMGLPIEWKVKGWMTKRILREAAKGAVPGELLRRRKRGLSVPLAGMFRRELREFLLDELEPSRLDAEGLLNGSAVGRMLAAHIEGRVDRSRALWAIHALVAWYRHHALKTPGVPTSTEKSHSLLTPST